MAAMPSGNLACPSCGHNLAADIGELLEKARALLDTVERYGVFVGSRGGRELKHFHRLTCKWAAEIREHNVVVFRSHDEALERGYRVCKTCSP